RRPDPLDALAVAHAIHLERPVMAHGVVARAAEQRLADRGAAGLAHRRVVALGAVAPQLLLGPLAHVRELRRALPDRAQPVLAPPAADVVAAAEARAILNHPITL